MANYSKTLNLMFNISEEKTCLSLENSDQSLSNEEFENFLEELKLILKEKFRKRIRLIFQFRSKFDSKIKPHINANQVEHLNSFINEECESKETSIQLYNEIAEAVHSIKMDKTTHVYETNVELFRLVYPQWIKIYGPQRKLNRCRQLLKIFEYDSLSNFKKREYSSYCVLLHESISTFLKNCEFMKEYFTKYNLEQYQINLNVEDYKMHPYIIESPKNIIHDLANYIAEIKFDGDRLLVARSSCSTNLNNAKYFPTDIVPCNWIFFRNKGIAYKKTYEHFPIESSLDNLYFPMICAFKSFKYNHEYEKKIEKSLREATALLETLLLEKKKDAILSDYAFHLNVDYSKEMIELEKPLVEQYFELIFPNLHGREINKGEMLSFQGDIEGVYDLFPSQNCETLKKKIRFVENICKKPCIVLECTFAYTNDRHFDSASCDKQKDILPQIKPSITQVREKDQFISNVLVIQDVYSINKCNLTSLPRENRMQLLDKMTKNPKHERISPSYRKFLKNENDLKDFMIESKKYSSSGIILRHITDESKLYSLKTKCCVDIILLGLKLKKGNLYSIYMGIVENKNDNIWFNKIGLNDSSKFTSRILGATKSIPDFLINDLYKLYDTDCFLEKPVDNICSYSINDQPTHFLKKEHRFVLEVEGNLKIFDNTPHTQYLLNNHSGMILTQLFVKRRRNDKTVQSANTICDLVNINESIKFSL